MNHLRCGCEDGRDCTKTTVCHVETAVEDYEYEIERLRHEIDVQCSSEYVERILRENERLRALLQRMWDEFPYEESAELARQELYDDKARMAVRLINEETT